VSNAPELRSVNRVLTFSSKRLILTAMSLNFREIALVVSELRPAVAGAEIRNFFEPSHGIFAMVLWRGEESHRLLLSARTDASRLHLLSRRVKAPKTSTRFVAEVRNAIQGSIVENVEQINDDRIVRFSTRKESGEIFSLVAELTGPASNILLLDADGKIITALKETGAGGRKFHAGDAYSPPAKKGGAPPPVRAEFESAPGISAAVERLYEARQHESDFREEAAAVSAALKERKKHIKRKRDNIAADLKNCSVHRQLLETAELLKANLANVPKGAKSAKFVNYFDPAMKEVEVELDPAISARVNMERMFKRTAKLKAALPVVEKRLSEVEEQMRRLDAAIVAVTNASTADEIATAKAVAGEARRRQSAPAPRKKQAPAGPRRFVSVEGMEILVGRNNAENDRLTMSIARGNDFWFHVQHRLGSHVVVRVPRGKTPSLETLLDAANLAVYFSKARQSSKVPVDYTQRKFVKTPHGAAPGLVTYSSNKTLLIDPDAARLRRLLQPSPGGES
jgi:predicted ribosome quality control (RQC) complex YloA/Tae2 family protein